MKEGREILKLSIEHGPQFRGDLRKKPAYLSRPGPCICHGTGCEKRKAESLSTFCSQKAGDQYYKCWNNFGGVHSTVADVNLPK